MDRRLRAHRSLENSSMAIDTVKWFNAAKSNSFIQPKTGGKNVFVH